MLHRAVTRAPSSAPGYSRCLDTILKKLKVSVQFRFSHDALKEPTFFPLEVL